MEKRCVSQAVEENGGAVQVATGSTFCVCLTASGKVVAWGQVPGVPRGVKPAAVEVEGLPPIRHIAAGHAHALFSDGVRVWSIGRSFPTSPAMCPLVPTHTHARALTHMRMHTHTYARRRARAHTDVCVIQRSAYLRVCWDG